MKPSLIIKTLVAISSVAFSGCNSDTKNSNDNVTSFSIERDTDLLNWQTFEVGDASISVPSDWKSQTRENSLVLYPDSMKYEYLNFSALNKNTLDIDYDIFAKKLAENAFKDYNHIESDTILKIEFINGFCLERNITMKAFDKEYKGHYLIYNGDANIYIYKTVLSLKTLNSYDGNLIKDILGNLKINKMYILSNENKMKNISIIRNGLSE